MKLQRCYALALILAFCGFGWAALQAASADNSYQAIVERNVFGLVPIPSGPPPQATKPVEALPKITPNGIMTIFGKLQVLFKVSEPGKPANQEDSYVMSVGDRQDDIEVQKINEESATITFNNHGTVQELALVEGKASTGAPSPSAATTEVKGRIPLPRPGIPAPHGAGAPSVTTIGSQSRHGAGSLGDAPNSGGGPAGLSATGANNTSTPKISPEEQIIMIEANRLKAIEDNNPVAQILPPTELTSQTLGEDEGNGNAAPTPPTPGH